MSCRSPILQSNVTVEPMRAVTLCCPSPSSKYGPHLPWWWCVCLGGGGRKNVGLGGNSVVGHSELTSDVKTSEDVSLAEMVTNNSVSLSGKYNYLYYTRYT